MPVSFPAHQALIVGAKLAAPRWIDGTALCIAATAPDLAYGFSNWVGVRSHSLIGLVIWAIPLTLVSTVIVRWRAADGVFGLLPDLGPLRIHSYRVLGSRSPNIAITVASAALGSASHIFFDAFTHENRWGSNWLGLNDPLFTDPLGREFTAARVLQYLSHSVGSLAFVVALVFISRTNRLERWYGEPAVTLARSRTVSQTKRFLFWFSIVAAAGLGIPLAALLNTNPLFLAIGLVYVTTIAVGALFGADQPAVVNSAD